MTEELKPCNPKAFFCECEQCDKYWQSIADTLPPDPPIGNIDDIDFEYEKELDAFHELDGWGN